MVEQDAKDNNDPDGKSCHHQSMGVVIIHPVLLHAFMQFEILLVLYDLPCFQAAFAFHGPDRLLDGLDVRDLAPFDKKPIMIVHVSLYLLDNGLHKLPAVLLLMST